VAVPEAGRTSVTGPPPMVQAAVVGWNWLSETMFRFTFSVGSDEPLVLRSTTTMSFPVAFGAPGVSGTVPALLVGAATTSVAAAESAPLGFCTVTLRFATELRSAAVSVVEQTAAESHQVARPLPWMRMVEPGPGLLAAKLPPSTRSVMPPAAPAVTLEGRSETMTGSTAIVTAAAPLRLVSSELVAVTLSALPLLSSAGSTPTRVWSSRSMARTTC